ncbi:MAG: hypothetical protein PF795_07145, partial [Kiritimatiellae bacterium]|nr:hypothetical protein [Kiritimatiellia bacterium]
MKLSPTIDEVNCPNPAIHPRESPVARTLFSGDPSDLVRIYTKGGFTKFHSVPSRLTCTDVIDGEWGLSDT